MEGSRCLGVLFLQDEAGEGSTGQSLVLSDEDVALVSCGEVRLELKGKGLDLLVHEVQVEGSRYLGVWFLQDEAGDGSTGQSLVLSGCGEERVALKVKALDLLVHVVQPSSVAMRTGL